MERDKKVSRLFSFGFKVKKKPTVGRSCDRPLLCVNPFFLRLGLIVLVALIAVFLAFPVPSTLDMGDIADRDVKADRDFMVEDKIAGKQKREDARARVPLVFDLNDTGNEADIDQVRDLFSRGRSLRAQSQVVYLPLSARGVSLETDREALAAFRKDFYIDLSVDPKDGAFDALWSLGFSAQVERNILQLTMDLMNQGVVPDKNLVLEQTDRGIVVRRASMGVDEPAPYPAAFPSLAEARRLIRDRAFLYNREFTADQTLAIVAVAQALLRPNMTVNRKETERRRQAAEEAVPPVFFQVKQGEMIVREGQRVDDVARLKLDAQAKMADRRDWLPKAGGFFILVVLFLSFTYVIGLRINRGARAGDRDVAFMASILMITLVVAFIADQVGLSLARGFPSLTPTTIYYLTPIATAGMLATVFLGPLAGLLMSVMASALCAMVFDRSLALFFFCFISSIAGMSGLVLLRERGAVIRSGIHVSLANIGMILALTLLDQNLISLTAVYNLSAGLLGGVLAGVTVSGLIPLFEMIFSYTTGVKLLELANLDRPILRELMVQAPGTYHHSVIVGAMVEAAAEAIGANPLLAKVSAYYHDLGKMKKPLYFVENQLAGQNKHEKLAPSMSSLILISHVKDGIELARKHKLSREIIDIIQQHHGTSLIAYFYHKAKERWSEDQPEIRIEDYRYPVRGLRHGKRGLVMLADAVEAASRTLDDPTPSRVQGMVQKIVNNIFSDGQLDECELTLKDLHLIARTFNKILTGIFHRRIAYPEPASKEAAKAKAVNGHTPKQPAKGPVDQTARVKSRVKKILNDLGFPDAELSLVLVGDDEIARLNEDYLGHQGPTNVISFPMTEGDFGDVNPGLLGDVVVSTETAIRDAEAGGYLPEEMLDFYIIHGILHLVGYDHLGSAEEAAEMEAKTEELWRGRSEA